MGFHRAGRVDEVPPGQTRFVQVNGTPVLLANRAGEIYALYGLCSHRGHPLEGATLWDDLVDCPWHHFQYDLRTGGNYYPKNVYPRDLPSLQGQVAPLRTYRVELRDAEIWVEVE